MATTAKLVVETVLNNKNFDKQITQTENKINDIKADLESSNTGSYKNTASEVAQLNAQLEKLENHLAKLKNAQLNQSLSMAKNINFNPSKIGTNNFSLNKNSPGTATIPNVDSLVDKLPVVASDVKDIKKGWDDASESVEKHAQKTEKSTKKSATSLKRLAGGIIGISSAYALASKASSAYLSQDEERAKKLQSVWIGLGSFLVPIIDMITNVMLKALGYLNAFITALTGTDYIANANARAIEKQAKSQEKLNKATKEYQSYDFDVIRTQQDNSSSDYSTGGLSASIPKIEIPELNKDVVVFLTNMAEKLKENWNWIKLVGEALLVTFGAAKIAKVLGGIANLIGGTAGAAGLAGLQTLLMAIAAVYVISLVIEGYSEVFKQLDELNEALDNNTDQAKSNAKAVKKSTEEWQENYKNGKLSAQQIEVMSNNIGDQIYWLQKHTESLENEQDIVGSLTGKNLKLTEQQKEHIQSCVDLIKQEEFLYNERQLSADGVLKYVDNLKKQIEWMDKLRLDSSELKEKLKALGKDPYYLTIKAQADMEALKALDEKLSKYGILGTTNSWLYKTIYGKKTNGYAYGGLVTQPTRSVIGEAGYPEYVLPEKEDYLSRLASLINLYGGNNGGRGGDTNIYFDSRLIQKIYDKVKKRKNFATNN